MQMQKQLKQFPAKSEENILCYIHLTTVIFTICYTCSLFSHMQNSA